IAQAVGLDRLRDVAGVLLEGELRRPDSDDLQAVAVIGGVQTLEERQRANAVDARVGPEVDQHNVSAQPRERQRSAAGRVEPALGLGELWRWAEIGQRRRLDPGDL